MANRHPINDPRTIAREIPGIFDTVFQQLTPGLVTLINRNAKSVEHCTPLSDELLKESELAHAMLFEISFALSEAYLREESNPDWDACVGKAIKRQKRHFDAKIPNSISDTDAKIAEIVAQNTVSMLHHFINTYTMSDLEFAPPVPGYQWIASGEGDFSSGNTLIEIKCSGKNFGSADYRQILMYWILSYANSIEKDGREWKNCILSNPRSAKYVQIRFDELSSITSAGRTKIETLELFSSLIGDNASRFLNEYRL